MLKGVVFYKWCSISRGGGVLKAAVVVPWVVDSVEMMHKKVVHSIDIVPKVVFEEVVLWLAAVLSEVVP